MSDELTKEWLRAVVSKANVAFVGPLPTKRLRQVVEVLERQEQQIAELRKAQGERIGEVTK